MSARRPLYLPAFTPAQIAALPSLFAWYGKSQLGLANGAAVATWPDESGHALDVTQGTAGKRHTWDTAGINGLGALKGSSANVTALISAVFGAFAGATIFAVIRTPLATPAADQYIIGAQGGGTRRDIFYRNTSIFGAVTNGGNFTNSTVAPPAGLPTLIVAQFNGAASQLGIDGITTTGNAPTNSPTQIAVGARGTQLASFDGWLGEFVYLNDPNPSIITRIGIAKYLQQRWKLAPSIPGLAYVDTAAGSDTTGSGRTPTSPLATATKAQTTLGDTGVIKLRADIDHPAREQIVHLAAPPLTLANWDAGQDAYLMGSQKITAGWTNEGGGIYSQAVVFDTTLPVMVMVRTIAETVGDKTDCWLRLRPAAVATLPAAGQFGVDSGRLYVHLPAEADPAGHIIEAPVRNNCAVSRYPGGAGPSTLATIGIQHWCGALGGLRLGVTGSPLAAVYADGGGGRYCGSTGGFASAGQYAASIVKNFAGWLNQNDGANIHGDPGQSNLVTLVDFDGSYNDDEGISPHDDTRLYAKSTGRARYRWNGSGGMNAVNQARCDVDGGLFESNQRTDVKSDEASVVWRDPGTSGSLTGGATITAGHGRGVRKDPAAQVTLGAYTSTANALPDSI